jgi:glycosyltransferase involved in cell wall biosynthesis
MQVYAMEVSGMDNTYTWDKVEGADSFHRITLTERQSNDRQWRQGVCHKIFQKLDEIKPDAMAVPGWSYTEALAALRWCSQSRVPAVVMSESTEWDMPRQVWRESIKRQIVRLCATALVGGQAHANYMVQLGMPAERVFLGYDAVDNRYFENKVVEIRRQKSESRKKRGLPERYFLASARFIEKKNLLRLIEAYSLYRQKSEVRGQRSEIRWSLVLLGDGPLRSDLCHLISDLGLEHCVHLPGFKQYDELPAYYGLASAFIHASTTEQWGLVVNEAMASGLPVLVSNRCGCAPDLVQEGENGFTFDPCNVEQLAGLMLKISAFNFPISHFGAVSQHIVADWGPERFAFGLKAAMDCALKVGPRPAGVINSLLLRALIAR